MADVPNGSRLLLVDDSTTNLFLVKAILQQFGIAEVECVSDSRETIARFESFAPDLVILDLDMPYLSGMEVLQQLVDRIPADTFLPILILSGAGVPDAKLKALASGAADFLGKPFQPLELFIRVRNLLQIRTLQSELRLQNQTLELKVAERTQELLRTQQQIIVQERLRAFGEMAGGIVHDFNNALMSVIGYSEMLLSDEELPRDLTTAKQFLTIMNTAGQDASHVIGRLRDFYRPREIADVFCAVNLNEIVEQAVPLTQPKWKGQALADGREINIDLDLVKLPAVLGCASELREVATNLIFNAADAMPNGGTITLRSRIEGHEVILEVCDDGIGMSEEVRARCLEPFFSTKGERGTGLGLSMVFGIVKRHEGRVEIDTQPGVGTTFRICFPAAVNAHFDPSSDLGRLGRSLTVLVVDDDPVSRMVLESYLDADGHEAVTAKSAEEALDRLRDERFDIVVTDHGMPGQSGTQLAAAIREVRPAQPILLVTGFSEDERFSGESGLDLVLYKPVSRQDFRKALEAVAPVCDTAVPFELAKTQCPTPYDGRLLAKAS